MPGKRILVVDDEECILTLVTTILRRSALTVDIARNGREALAMISRTCYDVIVLDLMMPEVSGLEVLKSLHTRFPQIKCVVLMSAGSSIDIAKAVNPNVFSALQKPFEMSALLGAVHGCIDGSYGRVGPHPMTHVPAAWPA